jgi:hypothetical protein
MDVSISLEMTIKDVPKEVILLGQSGMPDCLKIIISDGLKQMGYKSEIHNIKVESVGGSDE